jgi:hypothetical protein
MLKLYSFGPPANSLIPADLYEKGLPFQAA